MMALSRTEVEKDGALTFDGFLSFHCKTRADSKRVVRIRPLKRLLFLGCLILDAAHPARQTFSLERERDLKVRLFVARSLLI